MPHVPPDSNNSNNTHNAHMCVQIPTLIDSILHTKASLKLDKEVEAELKLEDPELEQAKAILAKATFDG